MGGKVTVIGSYNTGFVIYIDRVPSLGETVRGWGFRMEHGGKGSNQAVQAARLGSETAIVARVGNDVFGERALRLWRSESISTDHVRIDQDAPTGAGLVIVGPEGKNLIAVDLGANMRLSEEDVDSAEPLLRRSDVVLAQLEIPDRVALYALRLSEGIKVLNPAPAVRMEPEQLSGIDVITPNEVEMRLMLGEDQKLRRCSDRRTLRQVHERGRHARREGRAGRGKGREEIHRPCTEGQGRRHDGGRRRLQRSPRISSG